MARQVQIVYTSDLSGEEGEAVETIFFSLGDKSFEIDLTPDEHNALSEALKPYIDAGRPAAPKQGRKTALTSVKVPSDAKAVRAWAEANGYGDKLPARGRIPQEIRDAYAAAGN